MADQPQTFDSGIANDGMLAVHGELTRLADSQRPGLEVGYQCPNCQSTYQGRFGEVVASLVVADRHLQDGTLVTWQGCTACDDDIPAPGEGEWTTVYTLTLGNAERFDTMLGQLSLVQPGEVKSREHLIVEIEREKYLSLLKSVLEPDAWEGGTLLHHIKAAVAAASAKA